MPDVGRIAIRGNVAPEQVMAVLRAHWAGCSEVAPTTVTGGALALQQDRSATLGFVLRRSGQWLVIADSEEATADAALAAHLAEALEVPVLWATLAESADAARVTWFGAAEDDPREEPAALEAWLDARIPGWQVGWADPGGDRVAFGPVDSGLYVDDSAWLTAAEIQAGAIQVRAGEGVDQASVAREVAAYWLDCGAATGSGDLPDEPCTVIAGTGDRLVVAVSPAADGWITVIDSEREVADLGLADWLAATLGADVAWYWVDARENTAVIRLLGFDALELEPADDPESVVAFAAETFPLPFAPIDAADATWERLVFTGVDGDQYVTDPAWIDEG
jgi:hypothetical protein